MQTFTPAQVQAATSGVLGTKEIHQYRKRDQLPEGMPLGRVGVGAVYTRKHFLTLVLFASLVDGGMAPDDAKHLATWATQHEENDNAVSPADWDPSDPMILHFVFSRRAGLGFRTIIPRSHGNPIAEDGGNIGSWVDLTGLYRDALKEATAHDDDGITQLLNRPSADLHKRVFDEGAGDE